jgi:glutamate/tyrosine decarboxylase-like PLP-dependent enzyme
MTPDEFRALGHALVERLADHIGSIPDKRVMPAEGPAEIRRALNADAGLPETGSDAAALLERTTELLAEYSTHIGHPRFLGYITSGGTPLGALGDLLAAVVNPNVGAWKLAPIATEIESQTIRWIAELIGFPTTCGGLLVSGGNMANFVGVFAARAARADWDVRKHGMAGAGARPMRIYASTQTHTWVQKAADLCGMGTDAIRWIPTDEDLRMDVAALSRVVAEDRANGILPLMVVGTAGSVSTGVVDPLPEIAFYCRENDLWFHVDGAYGAVATGVPGAPRDLEGLRLADSLALDPHKWLYSPLEAGCALVRNPQWLLNAFSYHPPYYNFEVDGLNYFDYGMQNSRGFRALKVWLGLQQVGRQGVQQMIADDIALAETLFREVQAHPEFEAGTRELSITTFRCVPPRLRQNVGTPEIEGYLNRLNEALLGEIERSGEAFLSQAIVDGRFLLRSCVVNFRTSEADMRALPEIIAGLGRVVDARMRG